MEPFPRGPKLPALTAPAEPKKRTRQKPAIVESPIQEDTRLTDTNESALYPAAAATLATMLEDEPSLETAMTSFTALKYNAPKMHYLRTLEALEDRLALEHLAARDFPPPIGEKLKKAYIEQSWAYGPKAHEAIAASGDLHDLALVKRLFENQKIVPALLCPHLAAEDRVALAKALWRKTRLCHGLIGGLDVPSILAAFNGVLERVYASQDSKPDRFRAEARQNGHLQMFANLCFLELQKHGETALLERYIALDIFSVSRMQHDLQRVQPALVADLLVHRYGEEDLKTGLKYVYTQDALRKVRASLQPSSGGSISTNRDPNAPSREILQKIEEAEAKPVTMTTFRLETSSSEHEAIRNKFVVGFDVTEAAWRIMWGDIHTFPYHKNLFERVRSPKFEESLPKYLSSGGAVAVLPQGQQVRVILSGSSGDFGCYSRAFLESRRDEIITELQKQFRGKTILLEIETSMVAD